ncbi:MAG: phosphatidate cytidylyltransferase [Frankiaceae bacterium]|jgi:phosphatidate cytidylyltransferase|nr:phosphatidate cytidylyltransferase [Frankiaceae bacterium]
MTVPSAADVPDVDETPLPKRAGRNLPAAVAVGVTLGAVVLGSLTINRPVFGIGVVGLAAAVGMWEVIRALRGAGVPVPMAPLLVGGPSMVAAAYLRGADGLSLALVLTVLAAVAWMVAEQAADYLRGIAGATLVIVYVPLLASFAALLAAPDDGARRVVAFIAVTVCSDVGGYAFGVVLGRHAMAPSVSPKKSWEGFAGSAAACLAFGGGVVPSLFDVPVWQGLAFGAVAVVAATVGDLGESLLKRDLGIKDMSDLLPGHGGLMDRLDSLLFVAPFAWLMLSAWAPIHS